ncbi:MAG: AarF/ABC1/UbiB kinase family protein [Alphaproteobacteria bacterium]|nr:AarF/ABC1/UbiB kinase family protein [Alphaproteobacteria bacterium]
MDSNSFITKMLRIAQTSSSVATTAVKFASEQFLGTPLDHDKQAVALRLALGQLKGPVMKIAQFLATVPGALPDEYAREFLTLQSDAPPMNASFVRRRMMGELGSDWHRHFSDFNLAPSYAASLGQVHHAHLLSGDVVACKLQYPDMESIMDADLSQLRFILGLYEAFNKAMDTGAIFAEIKEKLLEELDYINESKNLDMYAKIFKDHTGIYVPRVHHDLTTKRLLTMDWCKGESVLTYKTAPLEERNIIAQLLFHGWYYPLYHFGVIHGDPHPGNYQVVQNPQTQKYSINLLDFGCVRVFPPDFVQGVVDLYRAIREGDRELMVHAYATWGFTHLTNDVIDVMSQWARMLYEPLLDDRVRPIQEKIVGWDVASKVHEELNRLGGIKPPPEFVFMDRAAVGIGSVLFHLKAELNWHRLFEELIENFDKDTITKAQTHF